MMGVPGLTTLLDANTQLLTDLKLRGTRIIIDGNNLYHFLYNLYAVPIQFGGDYDIFASAVTSFFRTLLKCDIRPVVVFDGPYDPSDRKIRTAIKRARDRITQAQNAVCGKKANLTPMFAQSVFTNVLDYLGVDHVTCESEADSEIAALANALGCPVLTNDSDFFIFDIQHGVVLLDYVNVQIQNDHDRSSSEQQHYINVQIYFFQKFAALFPDMDKDLLPLFATIMGNEKTEAKTFEIFFTSVRLPNHCSDKLFSGKRQTKMVGLLSWLESCGSLDMAVEKVLNQYTREKRPALRALIMDSVDSYRHIQISKTYPHLQAKWGVSKSSKRPEMSARELTSVSGYQQLPQWFTDELQAGHLSALTTNAAVSQQVILPTQAENVSKPSCHQAASSIRRVLYGILLRERQLKSTTKRGTYVEEIDRDVNNQKRRLVEPKPELSSGPVPKLEELVRLSEEERTDVFLDAVGISLSALSGWPRELQIYLTAVVYWIRSSCLKIDCLHLTATVVCVLKLSALDKLANGDFVADDEQSSGNSETLLERTLMTEGNESSQTNARNKVNNARSIAETVQRACAVPDIVHTAKNLDRFMQAPKGKSQSSQVDVSVIHAFSELQACVYAVSCLNEALASPLAAPRMDRLFNGSFLCHLYRELRSRLKPEQYIPELFARSETLRAVLYSLVESLKDCLRPGELVLDLAAGSKRSKKSKAKKVTRQTSNDGTTARETPSRDVIASCDINNKFAMLMLTDN